ncbi:MAG: aminopeptidase P family protein [Cyclobacteriaceae bacterium]|nr:aminopeptidase P family protein [Cyclobacteriaceae bacterium]
MKTSPIELRPIQIPAFGRCEEMPVIPIYQYHERHENLIKAMKVHELDVLLVFADREHSANLCYLTGLDPRFEEALLLVHRSGQQKLLLGNECMGYRGILPLPIECELFQEFSLMGQDRSRSRALEAILSDFGLSNQTKVGSIYYKYQQDNSRLDLPSWIADIVKALCGAPAINAASFLMDPLTGLRHHNCLEELVRFEWASCRTSESVRTLVANIAPGVREYELSRYFQPDGLPLSCHPMVSSGAKASMGLSSPSANKVQSGDSFTCAMGVWGALTARAGVVAKGPEQLEPGRSEFYERYWRSYFRTVVTWYKSIALGATAGEITRKVDDVRDRTCFEFAVNTGHTLHLDEWVHSPFSKDSDLRLYSGMALQMDIIPVAKEYDVCANTEDGIVLADEQLRNAWREQFPASWGRIQERRKFMQEKIGITLNEEVLPLSNMPACFSPYLLQPELLACL